MPFSRGARAVLVAAIWVGSTAAGLAAQETGTPVFQSPYRAFARHEFGAAASFQRGSETGIEGHFRGGVGQVDLGVRAGVMVRDQAEDSFLVGVGVGVPLVSEDRFPLRGLLVTGAGLDINGGVSLFVPVGLSLGRRLNVEKSAVALVPFVQPTVYFATAAGDDVGAGVGFGIDVRASAGFAVRVAGGIGTSGAPEGVALSIAWLR